MDSFLPNHFLYLLCSLFGFVASHALSVVDAVSNWWHAALCSVLALLPKAHIEFTVTQPAPDYHPAVLVTGTSSGIGHDTAIALATRGYTVFAGVRTWEDGARVESDFMNAVRPENIAKNPWVPSPSPSPSPWAAPESDGADPASGSSVDGVGKDGDGDGAQATASAPQHMRQRRLRRLDKKRAKQETNGVSHAPAAQRAGGGVIIPVILDVASSESIDAAHDRIAAELAQRDVPLAAVVNNAGVTAFGPMDISAPAFIDHCMTVNFHGPVRVTQKFMPLLRASRGRIVNISSIMSWLIGPGFGVYCASKAALSAVSRAWHYELASSGISVSVLEPGITRTALWHKVEAQLEAHHARLNGRRPARRLRSRDLLAAAMPGDEAVASASPAESPSRSARASDDEATFDRALYNPMIRRIKSSNELAPIFALPTHHAVAAVMHALTSRYPKSTYRVGWDARLMSLATWVASEETVEWLCRVIGIVSED
ncbi:hypothetical protein LPJ66_010369 [Kickxella alabastrina]|uniref:Uncharacterized protein n=1 Tax=Kickxella alabastrina TaxID=61397 RepID=A0ACC1I4F3_9FUNG|nr:hypothetical protein LPJ66_010369 [Kickxella alabastrina]